MQKYTTPPCIMCGEPSTLELDPAKVARWQGGEFIQNVWPEMPPPQRELLITGTHPACWDALFAEEA